MIIGQSLTAPILTGGMKSRIVVTCTGATSLTLTTPSSIVIPGVAVGNVYTFDNLSITGTYVVTASNGSQTKTQNVLVDVVGIYNVTVAFRLYLYDNGNECTSVTGGWEVNKAKAQQYSTLTGTNIASFFTKNKIDMSGCTTIKATFKFNWGNRNGIHGGTYFTPLRRSGVLWWDEKPASKDTATLMTIGTTSQSTITPFEFGFMVLDQEYGTLRQVAEKRSTSLYTYCSECSDKYWSSIELFNLCIE